MSFLYNWFAIAGLAAAAGPILIHLLNRRRYRVISWAAMDFLRQAVRRSRRIMQLRDLILLLLRTACVILFGLALAQPFLTSARAFFDRDQPVHSVLLIDNSLSMSYNRSGKNVAGDGQGRRPRSFIERLPSGSRISIVPVCGSAKDFSATGYATKADALEALASIKVVDREARVPVAVSEAVEACKRVDTLRSKQVVLISDQQVRNWPSGMESELKRLPCPLQIVQVGSPDMENTWIDDFHLQDGIGDLSTPGLFVATVRHQGPLPRSDVQVSLAIDGVTVATQSVDLQPDQQREVVFPPYSFDAPAEPGKPAFVTAEVSLNPPDHLPVDDHRFLVVPVVASLPVVFVDQHGADEDRNKNRFGETFHLRRLLAPVTVQEKGEKPLVQVQHVGLDRLDRDLLSDARLVVIAGVGSPRADVPLLREYVEQGGSLVICAGGDFDPVAWNEIAWQDGLGILPVPLKPEAVGQVPGSSNRPLRPFQIDFDSLHHDYFLLEQTSREDLRDLYQAPLFFKAIDSDPSESVKQQVVRAMIEKIEKDRKALAEIDQQLQKLAEKGARGSSGAADAGKREQLLQARAELKPQWLSLGQLPAAGRGCGVAARSAAAGGAGELRQPGALHDSAEDRAGARAVCLYRRPPGMEHVGRDPRDVDLRPHLPPHVGGEPAGAEPGIHRAADGAGQRRVAPGPLHAHRSRRPRGGGLGRRRLVRPLRHHPGERHPAGHLPADGLCHQGNPPGRAGQQALDGSAGGQRPSRRIGPQAHRRAGAGGEDRTGRLPLDERRPNDQPGAAQIYGQDFWEWLILAVIAGGLLELAILAFSSGAKREHREPR